MKAQKWNFKIRKYTEYQLPELTPLIADLEDEIQCANCGKKVKFGDCYTSKTIHTTLTGLGYPVCEKCYNKEVEEEMKYNKLRNETCPYCGKIEKGKEYKDELCKECQIDFGHKYINEL